MKQFAKRIHMVGIGGAGMSPLAEVLHSRGHTITGSDYAQSASTEHLQSLGIEVQYDHQPHLVRHADVLVYSSAVKENNAERTYALQHNIPCLRRAEVLGDVMRSNFSICISGTHGKTTTTSLVGTVMMDVDASPTVLVGGMLKSSGSHAVVGNGRMLVAEADEYDRSFLAMYPSIAVITNIEADHLDCYSDIEDIKDTFVQFTERVPFDGAVIVCIDDPGVLGVMHRIRRTVISYGVSKAADYRAENVICSEGRTHFEVFHKGKRLGSISLKIPGLHNVKNALAAVAVALETGHEFDSVANSISRFQGVKRRFEMLGECSGITVVDDYAHHPGEISATLNAARDWGFERVVAVFQPHLYSRTRDFLDEFAAALSCADQVVVTSIYKARECPIPGVTSEKIVHSMNKSGQSKTLYIENKEDISLKLKTMTKEGDAVVFMGAGDIFKTAREFLKVLENE
ncbi:MAG: UDP-N-acetylmuramate--L-alanine ligase [Chitinispirillaceae bacterium]